MKRILEYVRPYYGAMLVGFAIKFVGTVMDLAIPWILSHIIDEVAPTGSRGTVWLWGGAMALCSALALLGNVIANRRASAVSRDVTRTLRHDLFAKVERLSAKQMDQTTVPSLISRLTNQKGLDLVDCVIADIMNEKVQMAVLGMGDARYTNLFSWAEQQYRGRLAARFAMDHELAHKMYAGADFFLMPSLFEPCGLSQLISLRYGTIPIVRETGGLRDTVLSYNEYTQAGNGFTFLNYNAHDMLNVIRRALEYYREHKDVIKLLRTRGMQGDYSWTHSAGEYVKLYEKLTGKK